MSRIPVYVAFLAAGSLALAPEPRPPRATLFEGARLIDGSGGAPIEDSAFVVADGRFTQVGRKRELRAPADAARVDLTGKTVMPGLVDAHVHLGYRKGTSFSADNYTRENILDQLRRFAYWGTSAVLSTGTDIGDLIFQLRSAGRARTYAGTLIRTAGRGLAPPDAGPFPPMRAAPYGVRTEADARADVRELAANKVDLVKIWVDDRNGTLPKLSPAIYRAIIDEAHKNNLRVIAHVVTLADVKDLLRAGTDGFAHLFRDREADDEVLGLLKERPKAFFMLTLWAPRLAAYPERPRWLDDPRLRETASPEQIEQFAAPFATRTLPSTEAARQEWTRLAHNVVALQRAGVPLVLGTDVGGNTGGALFGWTEHLELELMVEAGLTPAQAILASTRRSAEVLALNELGTVAPGKRADFVVLQANPLSDIANSRAIATVYLHGAPVDRAVLKTAWSKTPLTR